MALWAGFANQQLLMIKGSITATTAGEAQTGMRSKEHRMGVRNRAKLLFPLLKATLELLLLFQDAQTLSSSPFAWITTNKPAKCVMKGCWLDPLSPLKIENLFLQPEMWFHFSCFARINNYSLDACRQWFFRCWIENNGLGVVWNCWVYGMIRNGPWESVQEGWNHPPGITTLCATSRDDQGLS